MSSIAVGSYFWLPLSLYLFGFFFYLCRFHSYLVDFHLPVVAIPVGYDLLVLEHIALSRAPLYFFQKMSRVYFLRWEFRGSGVVLLPVSYRCTVGMFLFPVGFYLYTLGE
jgi:hypothetical protein